MLKSLSAIILCGGKATRMGEKCEKIPKSMLQITGKPFLEWLVMWLQNMGISEIVLSTGHLSSVINKYFINTHYSVHTLKENYPLGTGGAISFSVKNITNDYILVMNGDTIFSFNIRNALTYHLNHKSPVTQVLSSHSNQNQGGIIIHSISKNVLSFENCMSANYDNKDTELACSTGAYLFDRKFIIENIPNGVSSLENELMCNWVENQLVKAYLEKKKIVYDFGTPERLKYVKKNIDLKSYFNIKELSCKH